MDDLLGLQFEQSYDKKQGPVKEKRVSFGIPIVAVSTSDIMEVVAEAIQRTTRDAVLVTEEEIKDLDHPRRLKIGVETGQDRILQMEDSQT
jgi:hypothetical protein